MSAFESLRGLRPINGLAARVASPGFQYTPDKKVQTADSPFPIAIHRPRRLPGAQDLTGRRQGRLVVVGLARDTRKRWVVRCDCGTFTLRTAKAIQNPANAEDRCEHCRHAAWLRRGEP